ncbi:hypothetical protein KY334_06670, partial [Candidatus Woesearchaeota archaeon]|nr:hypothetical protein [Candidatus Woesearchaeota archaeon]
DSLPTFVDLLGLEQDKDFMGKPMEKERRFFFYAQSHKNYVGMIKGNLKVIVDLNKKIAEVYDIEEDPKELNNLVNVNHYDEEILELLMWHHCQTNYFIKKEISRDESLSKYCDVFLE